VVGGKASFPKNPSSFEKKKVIKGEGRHDLQSSKAVEISSRVLERAEGGKGGYITKLGSSWKIRGGGEDFQSCLLIKRVPCLKKVKEGVAIARGEPAGFSGRDNVSIVKEMRKKRSRLWERVLQWGASSRAAGAFPALK